MELGSWKTSGIRSQVVRRENCELLTLNILCSKIFPREKVTEKVNSLRGRNPKSSSRTHTQIFFFHKSF